MATSDFGAAFKAARGKGLAVFEYNGRKYHTKTKEEMEADSSIPKAPSMAPQRAGGKDEGDRASGASEAKAPDTAVSRVMNAVEKEVDEFSGRGTTWGQTLEGRAGEAKRRLRASLGVNK